MALIGDLQITWVPYVDLQVKADFNIDGKRLSNTINIKAS